MPQPLRVTVVGAGYVGISTAVGMATLGHRVSLVENRADRLLALRDGQLPLYEPGLQEAFEAVRSDGRIELDDRPRGRADLTMICVGTPIDQSGREDLTQVDSALGSLNGATSRQDVLVIRSTLPLGSSQRLAARAPVARSRFFSNPEFLRQGSAVHDFLHPTRIVVGRPEDADEEALAALLGAFEGIDAPVLVVSLEEAEVIKNAANAFLGLKLSFANELAALCEEYGADVDTVLRGISLDPRIGPQYMRPSFGFGGSCLPKELQALAFAGRNRDLAMHVTTAASAANSSLQRRFADRIDRVVGGLDGARIALLGLAFKAGTDDVRTSPAVALADYLLSRGAVVHAYDPRASANALRVLPSLTIANEPEDALRGADVCVIATEWPEFRTLDWAQIRDLMARPVVVDGRRLLDAARLRALGYRYEAVGSPLGAETTTREPLRS